MNQNFYNNYLKNSYKVMSNQDEEKQYDKYFMKNFSKFLPKDKLAKILDIGIGNGRTLRTFFRSGYKNAFGVDIARDLIEKAKNSGLHCEYVNNTNVFLKNNQKKYSLINLSHIIEHIPKEEVVEFLRNAKDALIDEGVLIIVIPSVQNIFYVGPFWDFTHVNFFTERSLYQLCEAAGFKSIKINSEKMPINIYGKGVLNFCRFFISDVIIRCIQFVVNNIIKLIRRGIGTINPKILSPNLVCVCKK